MTLAAASIDNMHASLTNKALPPLNILSFISLSLFNSPALSKITSYFSTVKQMFYMALRATTDLSGRRASSNYYHFGHYLIPWHPIF
jgi:hypothetical protein